MKTPQLNDGGPAFSSWPYKPWKHEPSINEMNYYSGMTLRDWFAGQALPAVISVTPRGSVDDDDGILKRAAAKVSYDIADAMLRERSNP